MTITGFVRVIVFYNQDNGFAIAKIRPHEPLETDSGSLFTITGIVPGIALNQEYEFTGEWITNPKYGKQLKLQSAKLIEDDSKEGLIQYLSSDLFYGVGPKLATKIVDEYGTDCISMILEDPSLLTKVGVNERKTKEIHAALFQHRGLQSILVKLYAWNLSPARAMEVYQVYGADTIAMVEANPYELLLQFERLPFDIVDKIARQVGFSLDHPKRLQAICYAQVQHRFLQGDTYSSVEDILQKVHGTLSSDGISLSLDELRTSLDHPLLVVEEDRVYSLELYQAELDIAKSFPLLEGHHEPDSLAVLTQSEDQLGISYSDDQQDAITMALTHPFSIITGGPGTGKTTIIRGILYLYRLLHHHLDDVALLAPTGRAAKRMTESTNVEARTIHSFLGYDYTGSFEFGETNKKNVRFVIVDEASMMDTILFARLLQALPPKAQLVLIGDVDQLESVAPGQVLYDLLQTPSIHKVYLNKVYRHDNSYLFDVAYAINQGEYRPDYFVGDVTFIETPTMNISEVIQQTTLDLVKSGVHVDNIQLLAPMYKGNAGIDALNADLQALLNPKGMSLNFMGQIFRVNDKVLQLVNQPIDGVMNGEVGRIIEIKEHIIVDFDGVRVQYGRSDLSALKHAYCMSIHKSQGNEYDVVILSLSMSYKTMLTKKLLYTAATRAKKRLILIGDTKALQYGVTRTIPPRKTTLQQRLQQHY